jgi:hypothetical protein
LKGSKGEGAGIGTCKRSWESYKCKEERFIGQKHWDIGIVLVLLV